MLNLTQHVATADQLEAGVVEPTPEIKKAIQELLTFSSLEETLAVQERAYKLALIVKESGHQLAMIGGAPFLMPALEAMLAMGNISAHYAFSERVVVEIHHTDGSVEKKGIFKHVGFVPPVE